MYITIKAKIPWLEIDLDDILDIAPDTPLQELFLKLGIDNQTDLLITVNGKIQNKNYVIKEQDKITILPALIGG